MPDPGNGIARTFRDGAQWSAGRKQELDTSTNHFAQYDVEKLTLHPAPGDARNEILFTRKEKSLYAILPLYRQTLIVRDVRLAKGARISLLGSRHKNIRWQQRGGDVVISLPWIEDGALPFDGARVIKMEQVEFEP